MMMKKLFFPLILCILLSFSLCSCASDPSVGSELVTDSALYLKTNTYVQDILSELSAFPLPEEIPANAEALEYRYAYDCALLGDPNFSIKLVLRYSDENVYQQERQRIQSHIDTETVVEENTNGSRYFFGNTLTGLKMLTDDRIEDGNCAILQFAVFDSNEKTVTYAIGRLYDGAVYDDDIIRALQDAFHE